MTSLSPISQPMEFLRAPNLNAHMKEERAFREMERMFLNVMLKEMRRTVPEDGLFAKSPGKKIFEEMLDEVFAAKMAESGQLGIASAIKRQVDLQERQGEVRAALEASFEEETFVPLQKVGDKPAPFFDLPNNQPDTPAPFVPFEDLASPGFIPLKYSQP